MSSTNKTITIELSQYIGSDKPTYLTDYNGDMLKIDNAIASDRDGISAAQSKADTADGKADDNKTAIDTLNEQVNGNPEVPSQASISSRLADAEGDIDTLQSLIGDGTAMLTGQTIIAGLNSTESSIAPVENQATMGASYAIDDQFVRGGVLFTALVNIPAGTAWSALVVGTDYQASQPIVKQLGGGTPVTPTAGDVTYDNTTSGLTADDVQEAIDELQAEIEAIPSAALSVEVLTGTLTAGQTSVALQSDATIGSGAMVTIFTEGAVPFNSYSVSTDTITITFDAQLADLPVNVKIEREVV